MTHRPAILSTKVDRKARIVADADRLKSASKSDRPGGTEDNPGATLDEVRDAYADAMEQLANAGGSVAAVESVELPSERLKGDSQ